MDINFKGKIKVVNDTTDFTLESADHVIFDLFLAIVLVAIVMLLFLHSVRNAFIVMVSIPASLIAKSFYRHVSHGIYL